MSRRRNPGELVERMPSSGSVRGTVALLIRVPYEPTYTDEATNCRLGCGDAYCREWPRLEIINGRRAGRYMSHISECEMVDFSFR